MGYTPLRISTVKPDRELTFDLFIFFKETYLKYSDKGSSLAEEKFTKLRKQKIAKFYIDEHDEINYQEFLDKLLNDTMSSPNITVDEKVNLAEGACGTAVERMQENPNSKASYKMAESAARSLRQIISSNPEALKKIFGKKAEKDDAVIKHSLNVSALACKIANILELSDEELDNLATAALIHDIGITKMEKKNQDLFLRPRNDFSPEEKKTFALHIDDSLSMLSEKDYINKNILRLVETHEEILSGDGPRKISKLSKPEMILSLCDRYDTKLITSDKKPSDAIKEMMIDELGNYDLDLLKLLKKILKEDGLLD